MRLPHLVRLHQKENHVAKVTIIHAGSLPLPVCQVNSYRPNCHHATKVALLARRSPQRGAEWDSGNFLENNMNAKLSIVLVACVALLVTACASGPQIMI